MVLTDQPGVNSWPITGASFILMHKKQTNRAQALEVLEFLDWSLANGGKAALDLDYVPIPAKVVKMIEETWGAELEDANGSPVWKRWMQCSNVERRPPVLRRSRP